MVGVTPPSTRKAAPFVAADSGLATYATRLAISSGSIMRCSSDDGRAWVKNPASICAGVSTQRLENGLTFDFLQALSIGCINGGQLLRHDAHAGGQMLR